MLGKLKQSQRKTKFCEKKVQLINVKQNKQVAWGFQERWSRSETSWADAGLLILALVIQITLIQVNTGRSRINTDYKYKYQLIQITLILFNNGWDRINTNHYKLIRINTDEHTEPINHRLIQNMVMWINNDSEAGAVDSHPCGNMVSW